jgi:hypothetical protein
MFKFLFSFLFSIMMFHSFAVDDEGAGAGDIGGDDDNSSGDDAGATAGGADDIGDIDIGETDPKDGDGDVNTSNTEDIEALRKQIEELQAYKEAGENQAAQNQAVQDLQNKYDGFDSNAIKDYLVELNKTNPEEAAELNDKKGWELVWLTQIAPKVNNDVVSFGRNVPPVDRTDEVLERVNNGTVTFADEQDVLGKLLG